MANVKILEARKYPSRRPERLGQLDTLIVYNVDGKPEQTFTAFILGENPPDSAIQTAIRSDLADRQKMLGKSFTV
jgi:hypothetical protein